MKRPQKKLKKKTTKKSQKKAQKQITTKRSGISHLRFLVTGGSGSFGINIIKELLARGAEHIISISRHEKLIKQAELQIVSPFVKFKLGDITDKDFITHLMKDIDIVFNTAAIKHVSLAEENPREAHRVNITGLLNLLDASSNVKRFVHISSDKAIGVTNCYGATKLLGEYLIRESNELYKGNTYLTIRCPNLLGSRGSVVDMWKDQLLKDNKIQIHDPEMTRYFISLQNAGRFAVKVGLTDNPDTQVPYYPLEYTRKFLLKDLAEAFIKIHGNKDSKLIVTGAVAGEKKHEDYISDVSLTTASELIEIMKAIK